MSLNVDAYRSYNQYINPIFFQPLLILSQKTVAASPGDSPFGSVLYCLAPQQINQPFDELHFVNRLDVEFSHCAIKVGLVARIF